jgi:energy-coupling factor transporter ATP-binding protein EcfA2
VEIGGTNLRRAGARQAARLVQHVFQNPEAGFLAGTVEDELAYGPRALGWSESEIARHTRSFLERFGLAPLARANPFTLSEGQKRRLSVATSLVLGPRALLLDEPTFGQDRQSAQALMDEVAALQAQGLAIVIATHDLGLVAEYATRVVALVAGEVVFDGAPTDLIANDSLLEQTSQESPALDQIMRDARARGAEVPSSIRWRDLAAVRMASAV